VPRPDESAIPPEHYHAEKYDSLRRFVSYWHQIDEVRSARPGEVLEVGVGNGFVSRYLRERGFSVVTLDVNPGLRPNVLGSVAAIPFADGSFDVTAAYEVLEHLPQGEVVDALREMRRVTRATALISVPDRRPAYRFQVALPRLGELRWLWARKARSGRAACSVHRWEIGRGGVVPEDVRQWIDAAGFQLERDYRPFEHPQHHFFVLRVA